MAAAIPSWCRGSSAIALQPIKEASTLPQLPPVALMSLSGIAGPAGEGYAVESNQSLIPPWCSGMQRDSRPSLKSIKASLAEDLAEDLIPLWCSGKLRDTCPSSATHSPRSEVSTSASDACFSLDSEDRQPSRIADIPSWCAGKI